MLAHSAPPPLCSLREAIFEGRSNNISKATRNKTQNKRFHAPFPHILLLPLQPPTTFLASQTRTSPTQPSSPLLPLTPKMKKLSRFPSKKKKQTKQQLKTTKKNSARDKYVCRNGCSSAVSGPVSTLHTLRLGPYTPPPHSQLTHAHAPPLQTPKNTQQALLSCSTKKKPPSLTSHTQKTQERSSPSGSTGRPTTTVGSPL